jgi:hypothetical protein
VEWQRFNALRVTVKCESTQVPMDSAIFIGEKGKVIIDRNGFKAEPKELAVNPPPEEKKHSWTRPGWNAKPHMANWFEYIKTRHPMGVGWASTDGWWSDRLVGCISSAGCELALNVVQTSTKHLCCWDVFASVIMFCGANAAKKSFLRLLD